jgi:hypothetical protein
MTQQYVQPVEGKFGKYGGRYVPETLMSALIDLESEYARLKEDPEFKFQLNYLLREFAGRPTPLYYAANLTRRLAERRSTSNAKTWPMAAPTRSTTPLGKHSSRRTWERNE